MKQQPVRGPALISKPAQQFLILAFAALVIGVLWALVFGSSHAEADSSNLDAEIGNEGFPADESEVLQRAVTHLAEEWEISLSSATLQWLHGKGQHRALVLTDHHARCLVEQFATGVNATCDTVERVESHGLYLARFVRESGKSDQIGEVFVLAVAPSWATHLRTGPGGASGLVEAGSHSLHFTGDQVQDVDVVGWEAPDLGRSESIGLELPTDVPSLSER